MIDETRDSPARWLSSPAPPPPLPDDTGGKMKPIAAMLSLAMLIDRQWRGRIRTRLTMVGTASRELAAALRDM